jgi:copper chaperone CopZ
MEKEGEQVKHDKGRLVVSVKDINCTVCANAIQKQVMKLNGVADVKTSLMLNKVFIDYNPKTVDSSLIRKAIDKTGFKSYMTIQENYPGDRSS